jgi:hypothetical protein
VDLPGGQSRLREMILYVSKKSAEMPRFGKTKLNKILWKSDFWAFAERGTPVTGRPYQKLKAGPAPIEMPTMLAEMSEAKLIEVVSVKVGEHVEQRIVAKIEPSLNLFSPSDLDFVDRAIKFYWDFSAAMTSHESHGVAWKTRDELDPLPYEAAYLSDEKLPNATLQRIKALATEYGWKSK